MKLIAATIALTLLASTAAADEFEFKGLTAKSTPAALDGKTAEPCERVPNAPGGGTQTICVFSDAFLPKVADEPVRFAAASFADDGMKTLTVALPPSAYSRVETAFILKYGMRCLSAHEAAKWCLTDGNLLLYVDKGETRIVYTYTKPQVVAERPYMDF